MRVFLSYSARDQAPATELRTAFTECGVEVWTYDAVSAGASVAEAIGNAVKEADAFLLLISQSFLDSQWALFELGAAVTRGSVTGVPVVPILIEKGVEIPAVIRDRAVVDLTVPDEDTRERRIKSLVEDLTTEQHLPSLPSGSNDALSFVRDARIVLEEERRLQMDRLAVVEMATKRVATGLTTLVMFIAIAAGIGAGLTDTGPGLSAVAGALIGIAGAAIGIALDRKLDGTIDEQR